MTLLKLKEIFNKHSFVNCYEKTLAAFETYAYQPLHSYYALSFDGLLG